MAVFAACLTLIFIFIVMYPILKLTRDRNILGLGFSMLGTYPDGTFHVRNVVIQIVLWTVEFANGEPGLTTNILRTPAPVALACRGDGAIVGKAGTGGVGHSGGIADHCGMADRDGRAVPAAVVASVGYP